MRDKDLYAQILGVESPWLVERVDLKTTEQEVVVVLRYHRRASVKCPECGEAGTRHGRKSRRWRHLDTCQFRTELQADVPRVECPDHGVRLVRVPWAEPGSRFTVLFESLVIDWLHEASISAVAKLMGLSWDQVAGIMGRAVDRGMKRRGRVTGISEIGIDETSFQRRHEYVTAVHDLPGDRVLYVADGRGRESIDSFYESLSEEERSNIDVVAMDMHSAYIHSTRKYVPDADKKIAYDKFHIAAHLNDAIDRTRRDEHKELMAVGDSRLKGTKHKWLRNPENEATTSASFEALKKSSLKVARAWGLKEAAMQLWHYTSRTWARKAWKKWIGWALRSRLPWMKKVARTFKSHLDGIINAVVLGVTNARSEGTNAKIQWIKRMARGFRNRERFRNAIYFHLGRLDLYPTP